MKKIAIKAEKLKNALLALEKIYLLPPSADRINIDATIQRFEFTFELFWKFLKEFFNQKGLELNFPKDIIQEAYSSHLLDNETLWLQMLKDRNLTSHTYDEALANEIFLRIRVYTPLIRKAFDTIIQHS